MACFLKDEKKLFANLLEKNDIHYYGYVLLKSQPAGKNRTIRDKETNKVPRKPLKGRKKICEKNCRVVPITDKKTWDNLVVRMKKQYELWNSGAFGSDGNDYLIFDDLVRATSLKKLKAAYNTLEMRVRTWHCLRHIRGTKLFGETGDRELAKMWLGHGSNKVFEKYNHTYEEMAREGKRSKNIKRNENFEAWFLGKKETSRKKEEVSTSWRRLQLSLVTPQPPSYQ